MARSTHSEMLKADTTTFSFHFILLNHHITTQRLNCMILQFKNIKILQNTY